MEGPAPGDDEGIAEDEGVAEDECTEEGALGAREEDRNGTSARDDGPA